MSTTTLVEPRSEWEASLRKYRIAMPHLSNHEEKGRTSELGREPKKDVSYFYVRNEQFGELLHLHNFHTGASLVLKTSNFPRNTRAAKAVETQIAEAEAQAQLQYEKAASYAQTLYDKAELATEEHGYLVKKHLPVYEDLKASRNFLRIPIRNVNTGKLMSLQSIGPDGQKINLRGGKLKGGCYIFNTPSGMTVDHIVLAEGFATGASVYESIGWMTVVTFGLKNMEFVFQELRHLYPNAKIIFAADNDFSSSTNRGMIEAATMAIRYGCTVAVPEIIDGKSTDFSDVFVSYGPEEVKRQIEESIKKYSYPQLPVGYNIALKEDIRVLTHAESGKVGISEVIGDMLYVTARCRSGTSSDWSYWVEFFDRDGNHKEIIIPANEISGDGSGWLDRLTTEGYVCIAGCKTKLARYITTCSPLRRIRLVQNTGWHGSSFVTKERIFNPDQTEDLRLASRQESIMYTCGSLEGWQTQLGALLSGNPKYVFTVCLALAGPLLIKLPVGSGGFHFFGGSSCGKTTLLRLAVSVWSNRERMLQTWRATDNGLEGVAAAHNDLLLCLDEIHEADPNKVSNIIYMLGNEKGKIRASRSGATRDVSMWRLMLLSSGELSVEGVQNSVGRALTGGEDVRLASLPITHEDVRELHGYPDAGAFTQAIEILTQSEYGTLGVAYLEKLSYHFDEVMSQRGVVLGEVSAAIIEDFPSCDSQAKRVALRFALCCYAGYLAVDWSLLSLTKEEILLSAKECFNSWISNRGGEGSNERMRVLNTVKGFIESHGYSRFLRNTDSTETRIHNCVGFVVAGSPNKYAFYTMAFKEEVLSGHNFRHACQILKEEGWLETNKGRFTSKCQSPKGERKNVYLIKLPEEAEEEQLVTEDGPLGEDSYNVIDPVVGMSWDPADEELGFSL